MYLGVFRYTRAKAICVVLLSFSFLLMTFRLTKTVQTIRAFLFYWVSPTQEAATRTVKFASGLAFNFSDLVNAHRENTLLKESMKRLSLLADQHEELASENRRLRGLLELRSALPVESASALVSGRDAQSWTQAVWIDQGIKNGVRPDSPVLSVRSGGKGPIISYGVIGRIWELGPHTSKVLLISDPLSAVAVSLSRTSEQGLVQGRGASPIIVEYLDPLADFKLGDEVVTSGLGGIFPPGLPVGTLMKIITSPSGFKRATLRPAVPLNRLREVLILNMPKRDHGPYRSEKK